MKFKTGVFMVDSNSKYVTALGLNGRKGYLEADLPGNAIGNEMFYPFGGNPYRIVLEKTEVKRIDEGV